MSAPLVFNGFTIVSATASASNFGFAHRVGRAQSGSRSELIGFPGVAGLVVKTIGVADDPAVARALAFGSGAGRLSRIYGSGSSYATARAALETWLGTVETFRRTGSNLVGTLTFDGRTYTNMYWAVWTVTDIQGIFNYAPGGTAKGAFVDFTAEFVGLA